MTNKEIIESILKSLGYSNIEDVATQVDLEVNESTTWRDGWFCIDIQHKNKFYSTYARPSEYLLLKQVDPTDDDIKAVGNRIKAKIRQAIKLEDIKQTGIDNAKVFISNSFDIPIEVIKDSDLNWNVMHNYFTVNGIQFSYNGTITDKSCVISHHVGWPYHTYKETFKAFRNVRALFKDRYEQIPI